MTTHNNNPNHTDDKSNDNSEDEKLRPTSKDPDAHGGGKTRKDGGYEGFFGYDEHTLVQTPARGSSQFVPPIVRRLELLPAARDIVDVTLRLLDSLPDPIEDISVDSHYHYKDDDRWRRQLAERGLNQVHDLRSDEHGFTEINHTRWAAGWPHCPATPDSLGEIPRPAPGSDDDNADKHDEFERRIDEREHYSFRRLSSPTVDGTARWECPAVAGKIGCPLRQGTVQTAIELGNPRVENPPDITSPDAPLCCTQRSVTITPFKTQRKLQQRDYWGSKPWHTEWRKRTFVEGSYGNRKNPSTENIGRGFVRTGGLAKVNLMYAIAAASYNLRMIRGAHKRGDLPDTIDPNHPLLAPDDENYGSRQLTREEYEAFCAEHVPQEDNESTAEAGVQSGDESRSPDATPTKPRRLPDAGQDE